MPHPHEKGPVGGAAQPHCCRLWVDRRVRHAVWEFLTRHLHLTWGRGKEKNESPRETGKPTYADRDFGPLDERGTIPDGGRP
jgi:hypothetical protein